MQRQLVFQICGAVLLSAGPWLRSPALAGWEIETVDSIGNLAFTSIALDAEGTPHTSYTAGYAVLKYAAFNGSTWDIETVDTNVDTAQWPSIALDPEDTPHISYIDNFEELKYAYAYCGYVLAGDLNDNCMVDFRDVRIFVNTCWLSAGPECDLYVDSWVELHDFAVTAANWLIDCDVTPGDPACVPKGP